MDVGPYSCSFCSASVRTRVGLKIHTRKVHSNRIRGEKAVSGLNPLPERVLIQGLNSPCVCNLCGFCCTTNETLQLHNKRVHQSFQRRTIDERQPVADRGAGNLRSFAAAVRGRVKKSLTSALPPLCCTDTSNKPVAIYVPIYLTKAESELLLQFSLGRAADLASAQDQHQKFAQHNCQNNSAANVPSVAIETETPLESHANLEPTPIDVGILNEVLEFVCNEPQLSNSPTPPCRTFAISEEMLKAINISSDKVEVFEFDADFNALMGKNLFLYEFGNTVEIHVLETDGSTTVMNAVRKIDAKLESVPSAERNPA